MNDNYGNDIEVNDEIVYIDNGQRHVGVVEYDHNYRGFMRVNGRGICDILDHCSDVRVFAPR